MRPNSTSLIIIFPRFSTFPRREIYFPLGRKNFLLPRLKDCRGRGFFCKASGIFCKAFRKFCSACRFSLFGMGLLSVAMRDVNSRGGHTPHPFRELPYLRGAAPYGLSER